MSNLLTIYLNLIRVTYVNCYFVGGYESVIYNCVISLHFIILHMLC